MTIIEKATKNREAMHLKKQEEALDNYRHEMDEIGKLQDAAGKKFLAAVAAATEYADEEYKATFYRERNEIIHHFRWIIDMEISEWYFGQTDDSYIIDAVEKANPEPGYGDGVYDVLTDMAIDAYYKFGKDIWETDEDFCESNTYEKICDAVAVVEEYQEIIATELKEI